MFKDNIFIVVLYVGFIFYLEYIYIHNRFIKGRIDNIQYIKSYFKSFEITLGSALSVISCIIIFLVSDYLYLTPYKPLAIVSSLLLFFVSKIIQWTGVKRLIKEYPQYIDILSTRSRELLILYIFCSIMIVFILYFLNKIYFYI